jgi:hypothetical protein
MSAAVAAVSHGQVVDTPAAREFLDNALQSISRDECRIIARECQDRSARLRAALQPRELARMDEETATRLLRSIFATRRRSGAVLDAARPHGGLAQLVSRLCWAEAPLSARLDGFAAALPDGELACDLAGELLHAIAPDAHWLCSRWMWSPARQTGAVALVTTEADLVGATPGQTYAKLGRALLMIRASADAAGLLDLGPEPWNLDVLLACVYCVYLYTVTRMRMTREFNQVIPPLPDLARRILGLRRMEI